MQAKKDHLTLLAKLQKYDNNFIVTYHIHNKV